MTFTNASSILFKGMLEQNPNYHQNSAKLLSPLFDAVELDALLHKGRSSAVGLITFHISTFSLIVANLDMGAGLTILRRLLEIATSDFHRSFPGSRILRIQEMGIGEYAMFFEPPAAESFQMLKAFSQFRLGVCDDFSRSAATLVENRPQIKIGFALIELAAKEDPGSSLLRALCQAKRVAENKFDAKHLEIYQEYSGILKQGLFEAVFAPIVNLRNGGILGWESLPRNPRADDDDPGRLFQWARDFGEMRRLKKAYRECSLKRFGEPDAERMLFLSIHAEDLNDPDLNPDSLSRLCLDNGLAPELVALSFSEKAGIDELTLLFEGVEAYKGAGFKSCIEHMGAGNSNLRLLSQFRPDFIKTDPSLIESLENNPFKRVTMETMLLLTEKVGGCVIAGGVEQKAGLSTLISMGIHAAQGPYFGKAAAVRPESVPELPDAITKDRLADPAWTSSAPISGLAQPCLAVPPETRIAEVKALLEGESPLSNVVVAKDGRPLGILMRYALDRHLSTRYGLSLYSNKPVSKLMDASALVVEGSRPVEEAARAAMNRKSRVVYDDILVVEDGKLIGLVSVQRILDVLTQCQVELAKGSNPLTGLPGNVAIEMEISRRAKLKIPSSVIYLDLDNFKVYNDAYGFARGDKAILETSLVMKETLRAAQAGEAFLGHVGGDDFVIISCMDDAEAICEHCIALFEERARTLYSPEDIERGGVWGKGRDGMERLFPLMSVSMGIVDCLFEIPFALDEFSQRVAELKKYAKSKNGNSYVRDRRTPLGAVDPKQEGQAENA